MQKVLSFSRIEEAEPHMDKKVLSYINEGQIETFEGFAEFDVMAFDWHDVNCTGGDCSRILIYLDQEDLFFFCENTTGEEKVRAIIREETGEEETPSNRQMLYRFFNRLLKGDTDRLDQLETEITDTENAVLSGSQEGYPDKIIEFRRELLRLKRYYEQLESIFDGAAEDDNGLLGEDIIRRFVILSSRTDRYLKNVISLREYVAQMREAYQSQLSIQQNELMKIFTVVTVIFMPLTLLVGWYGMNFHMPELEWKYGYPLVIFISAAVIAWLIWLFKRKKWL